MDRSIVLVVTALFASGCGDGTPDSSDLGSSRRLGDTTFVVSSSPLRGTASLREVSRIGMIEGPPEYLLGRVPMFTVGPDGSLFVADVDSDLRYYDAGGSYVRTIARQGQGPGEVRYVVGMDVSVDGLLATLDFGNRRVSVFSPDGALVREIRLSRSAGRPGYGRDAIRWADDGQLWIALNTPRSGPDTIRGGQQRPLFGRLAGHEEVTDTVFLPTRGWEGCERRLPAYSGGFMEDERLPHMPFAQWSRSRMGVLAFGCSARFTMDVVRPDGGVMRVSRAWEAPVRTVGEHEFWSDGFRAANVRRRDINQSLESAGRGDLIRPIPPIPVLPRERPAYLRLWHTDDGRLWAWRGAPGWNRPWTEEERRQLLQQRQQPSAGTLRSGFWDYWSPTDGYDVFDRDGRWIGHVNTPESWDADPYPGIIDPYIKGDTIWAVVKEEFDVRYIVRFRVEWPSPN